jgi:hypothetical protein
MENLLSPWSPTDSLLKLQGALDSVGYQVITELWSAIAWECSRNFQLYLDGKKSVSPQSEKLLKSRLVASSPSMPIGLAIKVSTSKCPSAKNSTSSLARNSNFHDYSIRRQASRSLLQRFMNIN